ncbi:MAG: HAMP domain-containing histidine kinase [Hyphomicrobiales bacterium]|nr:HAMP domain-containing histidine kinase [Hyphomicrobiales bacterium]
MPPEAETRRDQRARPSAWAPVTRMRLGLRARVLARRLTARLSSSLTRRIIVLNLGGLFALLLGFLLLNQLRAGLIVAREQSLQAQASIIAAAVAASGSVDADTINLDPSKLLQLEPATRQKSHGRDSLNFSIDPEDAGPLLVRVVPPRTRARVFDRDGYLLVDTRELRMPDNFDIKAAPLAGQSPSGLLMRGWVFVQSLFARRDAYLGDDVEIANGKRYPEVDAALKGIGSTVVRQNTRGETIISVAEPVQRLHVVRGVLLLSTQGGDIDRIIAAERWAILRVFLVSAGVMFLLSLFLAGTIAEPIRRLSEAADRVRRGQHAREEIPDYSNRTDEIGQLSASLRDMTRAMYNRIEAIESFAADVAHELKNPLTSLRSAIETLPLARKAESRDRLMAIAQHDVRRLDRLISDISSASRLDAELARGETAPVDLAGALEAVAAMANQSGRADGVTVTLKVPATRCILPGGHESRLVQVFNNLIDNARSFSPRGGTVRIVLRAATNVTAGVERPGYEVVVDDDGPGIPGHALERVFERFYTDRPDQGFGQNSGLGLSISRQIVEAHGGTITAANREGGGARFTVWLPGRAA